MSDCINCKDSILSQTVSKITAPLCNDACPESIVCVDIIPSNCVFYSGGNLSCSGIVFGETLTTALAKIDTKLCENSTSNTVQITANDTCYGYLASKITSSSLAITTTNPGACEKLNIEEKCWCYGSLEGYKNKWKSVSAPFQIAQISNVKECVVKLRGMIINPSFSTTVPDAGVCQSTKLFTIPAGKLPSFIRTYTVFLIPLNFSTPCLPLVGAILSIDNNTGDVNLKPLSAVASGVWQISLEGISWEIGTNC